LKNILILIVICLGVWQFMSKENVIVETSDAESLNNRTMQTLAKAKELSKPKVVYKCDGRQHCSQMNSYEEAKYFIQHCPKTKMDGDHDGIPCERQFNK